MLLGNEGMEKKQALIAAGVAIFAIGGAAYAFSGDNAPEPLDGNVAAADRPSLDRNADAALAAQDLAQITEIASPGMDAARPTDCLIEPSQTVRVNSGVEGVIQAIYVDRGDVVSRGQVVAQLRSDVDRAGAAAAQARANNVHGVRAAETRAAYLDTVRSRSEEISEFLSADAVDEAKANARAAQQERNAAAEDQRVARLEYVQTQRIMAEKTVRSPVAGIVTERLMSPGEYRGPDASHIITIAQVHPLHVEVFAPIAQLSSVHIGDEVTIYPEDPVGGKYIAKIKIIDRVMDAASGTFGMRLELPNPDYALPAGLRCTIEIASGETPSSKMPPSIKQAGPSA